MQEGTPYTFEDIAEIAAFLKERTKIKPKIGIICGSGLGKIAELVDNSTTFPYKNIPNFPVSTVPGHAGNLLFGTIDGVPVVCMQGRFHYYEGYPLWKCVMPVRLMKLLGVTHLIASNAAGGVNRDLKTGDIMLIKDHVNIMGMAGNNPLKGINDERFGERFIAMNNAYNPMILKEAKRISKDLGLESIVKEGVYTCMGGPNYETVAELKMMELIGVDAVGMSTVHEVVAARHCGIECFAFSLITNVCVISYDSEETPNSEEIIETADSRQDELKSFMQEMVKYIGTL